MLFCPRCGNMLVMLSDSNSGFYFGCRACPYKHDIDHAKVRARKYSQARKKEDDIFGGENDKDNLAKTEADCPKCRHNEAYFEQMQTRSADEPMTIFYCCTNCDHKWNDGS